MLTNILLAILVVLYLIIYRLQIRLSLMGAKKRHFFERLNRVNQDIWDKEFQKLQTMEMRESIRLDRDRAMEAVDAFKVVLKTDHKPETVTELESKKKQAEDNAERFTAQLRMLDEEVVGAPYMPANPSKGLEERLGKEGLNDTIASTNEVKKMIVSYIKSL